MSCPPAPAALILEPPVGPAGDLSLTVHLQIAAFTPERSAHTHQTVPDGSSATLVQITSHHEGVLDSMLDSDHPGRNQIKESPHTDL